MHGYRMLLPFEGMVPFFPRGITLMDYCYRMLDLIIVIVILLEKQLIGKTRWRINRKALPEAGGIARTGTLS
jgi:hypothetical protein